MSHTQKVKSSGRFGARYGKLVRTLSSSIESKQRKRQKCPHCKKSGVKRLASGIWKCPKCEAKFASAAYYLDQ